MKSSRFQMEFFETYYFCNIANNVLADPLPHLRHLNDIFGDQRYSLFIKPFPKYSALHYFISEILRLLIDEGTGDGAIDEMIRTGSKELWVNRAMKQHGIEHQSFSEWLDQVGVQLDACVEEDIVDYHGQLYADGPFQKLQEQMVDEVFYVMFMNRDFLRRLNEMIASEIKDETEDGVPDHEKVFFSKPGVLRRVAIPSWVKRAVFYRDRGACGKCNIDISGLVAIENMKHFDHIVPLAQGGINDVTNVQLLCEKCNLDKRHLNNFTSKQYERWY